MARYVATEIREIMSRSDVGEEIGLALVVNSEDGHSVSDRVTEFDGELIRTLPSGVLIVSIPQQELEGFLDTPKIQSASSPDRMEVLN